MKQVLLDSERCKACALCIIACPAKALKKGTAVNRGGFEYVELDEALCKKCGVCYTACPDGVFTLTD